MEIVVPKIVFSIIFGIIFGIIFARIYPLIPGKPITKGLLYGLGLYSLIQIRYAIFAYAYGYVLYTISILLFITPIIYGLILGILYKAPIQTLETKHNAKDDIIPGVITGIIFGAVVIITFITTAYVGFVYGFMEAYPEALTDIQFIINQYGSHTVINMFLMACYGAIYVRFYDTIPGKPIIKGAIFGAII